MGRPPLSEDQVRDKVLAYCARYGVSPGPEGLPPFPSGKRETRQHRDWLTVYRALQRSRRRAAAAQTSREPGRACPVCGLAVGPEECVRIESAGRRSRGPRSLHPACADLARLAEKAGPDAVARLSEWLWPGRRPRGSSA
jgi:hypothetical protein